MFVPFSLAKTIWFYLKSSFSTHKVHEQITPKNVQTEIIKFSNCPSGRSLSTPSQSALPQSSTQSLDIVSWYCHFPEAQFRTKTHIGCFWCWVAESAGDRPEKTISKIQALAGIPGGLCYCIGNLSFENIFGKLSCSYFVGKYHKLGDVPLWRSH